MFFMLAKVVQVKFLGTAVSLTAVVVASNVVVVLLLMELLLIQLLLSLKLMVDSKFIIQLQWLFFWFPMFLLS